MRLKNNPEVQTIKQTEEFILRNTPRITFEIQALPPDYDDSVEAELPSPEPKRLGIEKDGKGRAVLDSGGNTVMRYDTEDPDFRKANGRNQKLQAVKMFVDGVAPGQLEFTAKMGEDASAFYAAVLSELKAFGFSMGDLLEAVQVRYQMGRH